MVWFVCGFGLKLQLLSPFSLFILGSTRAVRFLNALGCLLFAVQLLRLFTKLAVVIVVVRVRCSEDQKFRDAPTIQHSLFKVSR